ncbi:MAG TPA: hypothetical protein VE077_08940 [Candidatus Methylomirabilis sp.]|nr:hypothetical protein [Candidatus Methylomirabilis sp.]
MSTVPATSAPHQESTLARLGNLLVGASFAIVLLVPKVLRIRQSPGSWFAFRTILGTAGVALVLLPLTLSTNWIAAPAGLCMFLASILLGPAKRKVDVDSKARELGALIIVNGGCYQLEDGALATVQLYVGAKEIHVLDSHQNPVLVIPVDQISSAVAIQQSDAWALRIHWLDHASEFAYRGVFAEHLARVAENTVASVIPSPLPVLQRRRAAGA